MFFRTDNISPMLTNQDIQKLSKILATKDDIGTIHVRIDRIESRIDRIEIQINHLDINVDSLAKKMDNMEIEHKIIIHYIEQFKVWFEEIANKLGIKLLYK